MKQHVKVLLFAQLITMHSLQAAVLTEGGTLLPTPTQNTATTKTVNPPPRPQPQQAQTQAQPQGQPHAVTELRKLSPEEAQQLINQTKDLKPEELQAIAKSLSAQPKQGPPSALQARINQLGPNAGLIEEVVPAKVVVPAPSTAASGPTAVAVPVEVVKEPPISPDEMKRQQAFNALMQEVLPLSPDQIMDLHKFYDLTLEAKSASANPPPKPNFTSIIVNLEPGTLPPVVRLAAGFVTSILFVDSTGSAWPITAYSIGDPQTFNIQWDQKSNALFIQSLKQYAHGNLAVRLWGLETPVMLTLVSGQRQVDFRVDLQVMGRGPAAKAAVVDTTFNAKVNPLLINILDGIPPRDSIKLTTTGGHGEAWLADNRIYFRTKLTVLSPAWTATVSSADGTHVYELMLTPFILASEDGKTIDIKLSGY